MTTLVGEKFVVGMIATLCDALESEYGVLIPRLYRIFKPLKGYHHHTTTVLRPFFRDHQPVPEENFWTLWCKGRLTEADILTIQLGATPSGLTSAHLHHPPIFFATERLLISKVTPIDLYSALYANHLCSIRVFHLLTRDHNSACRPRVKSTSGVSRTCIYFPATERHLQGIHWFNGRVLGEADLTGCPLDPEW